VRVPRGFCEHGADRFEALLGFLAAQDLSWHFVLLEPGTFARNTAL
jgi:hypothetical protein